MNIEQCAELFSSFSGKTLFVGFSGGADSCAALLITAHFAGRYNFTVTAVHINHHLRGEESDREEKDAEAFAAKLHIPFRCFHVHDLQPKNLEAEARAARLKIWQELTSGQPESAVVLGHHADDRVETLFLRLIRGSNSSGLAALRPYRKVGNVIFLRPLLNFRRCEIEEFLKENAVEHFASDSSNREECFLRNYLRTNLLKSLFTRVPQGFSGMTASLAALEEDAAFLEEEARRCFGEIRGKSVTAAEFWRKLPGALQSRVLRLYLSACSGVDFIPDRALICRFRKELNRNSNKKRLLPIGNGSFLAFCGERIYPETETEPLLPCHWLWRQEPRSMYGPFVFECALVETVSAAGTDEAFFDADQLPDELFWTSRQNGDTMIPFGKTHPVSLKKLRINSKCAADTLLPVLRDRTGRIFWVPGVRHSNLAAVDRNTRHILRVCRISSTEKMH